VAINFTQKLTLLQKTYYGLLPIFSLTKATVEKVQLDNFLLGAILKTHNGYELHGGYSKKAVLDYIENFYILHVKINHYRAVTPLPYLQGTLNEENS